MAGDPYDERWGGRCEDQVERPEGGADDGRRLHFCCGGHCPGYPFRASRLPHPVSCVTGGGRRREVG